MTSYMHIDILSVHMNYAVKVTNDVKLTHMCYVSKQILYKERLMNQVIFNLARYFFNLIMIIQSKLT